ncbi:MAG: 2-amino-4-hydroxy-6-hydroxymethyldihydropteridine diphosphokinase, partial [Candidatus Methylumidiphilus sp.]
LPAPGAAAARGEAGSDAVMSSCGASGPARAHAESPAAAGDARRARWSNAPAPAVAAQESLKLAMTPEATLPVVAYIGLGGNLENPLALLNSARLAIAALPDIRELAFSSFYHSKPMGPSEQPDYVNAVMAVETSLAPHDLLNALQAIEFSHGRVRTGLRWGPRTLDLDILTYGLEQIEEASLTVPHTGIAEREFVLYPMAEIAPSTMTIPGKGKLCDLVAACPRRGLEVIAHD